MAASNIEMTLAAHKRALAPSLREIKNQRYVAYENYSHKEYNGFPKRTSYDHQYRSLTVENINGMRVLRYPLPKYKCPRRVKVRFYSIGWVHYCSVVECDLPKIKN
jgi:hypothetical protein